jgi:hypothetical protein
MILLQFTCSAVCRSVRAEYFISHCNIVLCLDVRSIDFTDVQVQLLFAPALLANAAGELSEFITMLFGISTKYCSNRLRLAGTSLYGNVFPLNFATTCGKEMNCARCAASNFPACNDERVRR